MVAAFELWRYGISTNMNLNQKVGIHKIHLDRKFNE